MILCIPHWNINDLNQNAAGTLLISRYSRVVSSNINRISCTYDKWSTNRQKLGTCPKYSFRKKLYRISSNKSIRTRVIVWPKRANRKEISLLIKFLLRFLVWNSSQVNHKQSFPNLSIRAIKREKSVQALLKSSNKATNLQVSIVAPKTVNKDMQPKVMQPNVRIMNSMTCPTNIESWYIKTIWDQCMVYM